MMTCERASEELTALLYNEADAPTRAALEEHLGRCPRCAAELETLRAALGVLRSAAPPAAPPGFSVSLPRRRVLPRAGSLMAASIVAALLLFFLSDGGPKAYGDIRVEKVDFSLTVYNRNLALVRDRRNIFNLRAGRNIVRFSDVPAYIDPTSVHFFSLTDATGTRVVEQNFEFDLVSADALLRKFLDESIECVFKDGSVGKGRLLSYDPKTLVISQSGEALTLSRENIQSLRMPKLPEGLLSRPTLVWDLDVKTEGKHETIVSYLTGGMAWKADYTAISKKERTLELSGWVTVTNQSGATYENAKVKLIAGDVHRVRETFKVLQDSLPNGAGVGQNRSQVEEQSFFEYHLYTLVRTTTLRAGSVKQVEFVQRNGIPARHLYEYDCTRSADRVAVKLEFKNTDMPLPMGQVRLSAEVGPSTEFVRAISIEHTPKDEKVVLLAGYAFDLAAERKVTRLDRNEPGQIRRQDVELKLRNHKDEDVEIDVLEPVGGNGTVESSEPHEKLDAYKIRFVVAVPKHSEKTLKWRIDYE
jgi:hypothetical protein